MMVTALSLFLISGTTVSLITAVSCRPQILPVEGNSSVETVLSSTESVQAPSARSLLIADLKSKILKHLKITQLPTRDLSTPRLTADVVQLLKEEQDISDAASKENLIIHASNSNSSCLNSNESLCRRFEFTITSDLKSVISVNTWFHRREPFENLMINIYSSTAPEADLVIKLKEHHSKLKTKSGWITFELPKLLALEPKNDEMYCTVEVEGSSVDDEGDLSPFLVVSKTIERQKRKRRTVSSNENCTNCCTESQLVTVEELEWKSWVISPTEFDVKTCKGHCTETHSLYRTRYQTIMNTLHKLNSTTFPKPVCSFWTPSCQPTRYLPLRLMYDNNGTVHDQIIPEVIIESCQCL